MEWCRLLHVASQSGYGYPAASILMTLWGNPELAPLPSATPCYGGVPGPIEVTVTPTVELRSPTPNILAGTKLVLSLYTGDFRRALYSHPDRFHQEGPGPVAAGAQPSPITMCVQPQDTLVATVWGWHEPVISPPLTGWHTRSVDPVDTVVEGVTETLSGPGFGAGSHVQTPDGMSVAFDVSLEASDLDGDGLSSCGESYCGADPADPDPTTTGSWTGRR
jgi:hypothetical protein